MRKLFCFVLLVLLTSVCMAADGSASEAVPVPGNDTVVTVPPEALTDESTITESTINLYTPRIPKGTWFIGGGPVWNEELGLSFVAGYQAPNRVMVIFGPTYVPYDDIEGRSQTYYPPTTRRSPRRGGWNSPVTLSVPPVERDKWGMQLLVIAPIDRKRR